VPAVRLDGGEALIVPAQSTLDDLGTIAQQTGPSAPRAPDGPAASYRLRLIAGVRLVIADASARDELRS
jgi:hypothetical protein